MVRGSMHRLTHMRHTLHVFTFFLALISYAHAQNGVRRRGEHTVIQAGNKLVIHGGRQSDEQRHIKYNGETLLIPLDQSWTNGTVNITSIQRTFGLLYEALWWDETREILYSFSGKTTTKGSKDEVVLDPFGSSSRIEARTPTLRALPMKNGPTTWSTILGNDTNPPFPSTITGSSNGAYCSDNTTGFYLGGSTSIWSSLKVSNSTIGLINTPGIIRLDFGTQSLANSTDDGGYFASRNPSQNESEFFAPGRLIDVPFGPNGTLISFGGGGESAGSSNHLGSGWENIFILEKSTNASYFQSTTGDVPTIDRSREMDEKTRSDYCFFYGIDPKLETFDIFVYGSWSQSATYDSLYILSLPSFTWVQADFTNKPRRTGMQCVAVSTNNQAIFVGGFDLDQKDQDRRYYNSFDEWTNGIGVFDMNELRMKDKYDADALAYSSPGIVKDRYDQKGRYPSSWTSDEVEAIFKHWKQSSRFKTNSSTENRPSNPNNSSVEDGPRDENNPPNEGSSRGIIGGSVAGGVILIVIGICYLLYTKTNRFWMKSMLYRWFSPKAAPQNKTSQSNTESSEALAIEGGFNQVAQPRTPSSVPDSPLFSKRRSSVPSFVTIISL